MLTQNRRRTLQNICLAAVAIIPLLFVVTLFTPFYHEVCEKNQYNGNNDCSTPPYSDRMALVHRKIWECLWGFYQFSRDCGNRRFHIDFVARN